MKNHGLFRKILSAICAVCLLLPALYPAVTVSAEDTPQTTTAPEAEPSVTEAVPEETDGVFLDNEPIFTAPYPLYFGLLHAHTGLSSGQGSVSEAFTHAANVDGLDFFAVTDHSNSFDNAGAGSLTADGSSLSTDWAAGKDAVKAVTDETFLGLFGFEMSWEAISGLGHIATFGTPGWVSRDQQSFQNPATALESYYQALTEVPGSVSQFCHPGDDWGDFELFGHYREEYDDVIHLLEVASGEEEPSWAQYPKALDAGWHVAPSISQNNHNGSWGDANAVRTVVLAESLTEESLFDAIRHHRVYATEDQDLHIYYELNGEPIGSVLPVTSSPELTIFAYDPTDTAIGTLEVITEGGVSIASKTLEENDCFLTIPVTSGYRYYYLQITQPDGDKAVTAPIWIEEEADVGIGSFTASPEDPVQGEPITLTLSIYNNEAVEFTPESVEFYADGQLIHTIEAPDPVAAQSTGNISFSYTHPHSGETELRAIVQIGDRSYEETLTLRFRTSETVTGLIIDGSHQNGGLDSLARAKALAAGEKVNVTVFTGAMPRGGEVLLIPDPKSAFEEPFLQDVLDFLKTGGDLILWGSPEYLHPLLESVGSLLRLNPYDLTAGACEVFNSEALWCRDLLPGQYFSHPAGVSVEPGNGQWLVHKFKDGPCLLAREETPWGGSIFLAGAPFLLDAQLPKTDILWSLPSANETIFLSILGAKQQLPTEKTVADVRKGTPGETFRIKGYITAGTSNPFTTLPEVIYVQDDTGGIPITGYTGADIQIGTAVELVGQLGTDGRNPILQYIDHKLPKKSAHFYTPKTIGCKTAMDYSANGGKLLQVEGKVTKLTLTGDRKGIARLEIEDIQGNTAVIEIEEGIFSGATGENLLAKDIRKGRTVRAIGLLHINEAGETVLRVRNCDEVVYVPPKTDYSNPRTGDRFWFFPF